MSTKTRFVLWTIGITILVIMLYALRSADKASQRVLKADLASYTPNDPEAVEIFEEVLIQEGGRVKPIKNFARFMLLNLSGNSKVEFVTKDGETHKITETEWFMDVLFRGEIARKLPTFVVDNTDALVAIGVSPQEKRGRYAYDEITKGRAKLSELTMQLREQNQKFIDGDKKDKSIEL
ncbi:MAG: hypothetical protein AAF226_09600, partial [Verrucomicrobiota bacterium]